jgi:hypothetical protein
MLGQHIVVLNYAAWPTLAWQIHPQLENRGIKQILMKYIDFKNSIQLFNIVMLFHKTKQ